MRKRSRVAQWLVIIAWSVAMAVVGGLLTYALWGAGAAWAEMPAHGTWSPQAGVVMFEMGWEQEPFSADGLPRWQPWSVRGVPIVGRFGTGE